MTNPVDVYRNLRGLFAVSAVVSATASGTAAWLVVEPISVFDVWLEAVSVFAGVGALLGTVAAYANHVLLLDVSRSN